MGLLLLLMLLLLGLLLWRRQMVGRRMRRGIRPSIYLVLRMIPVRLLRLLLLLPTTTHSLLDGGSSLLRGRSRSRNASLHLHGPLKLARLDVE
jgi:hypothetical protein